MSQFGGEVIAEQAGAVLLLVGLLRGEFEEGLVGDVLGGPDLAMGVGIGGAHHGAAVLEDLHVVDPGMLREGGGFKGPGVDDGGDFGHGHAGERERVVGVKAEDAATAALGLGDEQRGFIRWGRGRVVGQQRGKVVVEGEDGFVVGIVHAAGAGVGGAEITGRVVGEAGGGDGLAGFALPGTLGALRRDENPLAQQGIVAAVGDEIERAGCGRHGRVLWRKEATATSVRENAAGAVRTVYIPPIAVRLRWMGRCGEKATGIVVQRSDRGSFDCASRDETARDFAQDDSFLLLRFLGQSAGSAGAWDAASAAADFRLTWLRRAAMRPAGMMESQQTTRSSAPQAVAASMGAP